MIQSVIAAALSVALSSPSPVPRVATLPAQPTGIFNARGTLSAAAAGRYAIVAKGDQLIAFDEAGRRIDEETVSLPFDETFPTLQRYWSASGGEFAFILAQYDKLFRAHVDEGELHVVEIPLPHPSFFDVVVANGTHVALANGGQILILDHSGNPIDSWSVPDSIGTVRPIAFRNDGSLVVYIDKNWCGTICMYLDLYVAVARKGVPLASVPHHHLGFSGIWPAAAINGENVAIAWVPGDGDDDTDWAVAVIEAKVDQNRVVPMAERSEVKGQKWVDVPGMNTTHYEPTALFPMGSGFVLINTDGPLHTFKDGVLTASSGGPYPTQFAVPVSSNRILRFFVHPTDRQLYAEPLLLRVRPRTVRR